jgi:hypothetical protein
MKIFGSKRDEATGEWRKLHNEELNNLYSSPNIVWVIKSRIMRWVGHVARVGERRDAYIVLMGKPEAEDFRHFFNTYKNKVLCGNHTCHSASLSLSLSLSLSDCSLVPATNCLPGSHELQ